LTQTPRPLEPGAGAERAPRRLGGPRFSSPPVVWLVRALLLAVAAFLALGGLAHIAQRLLPEEIHYKDVLPMSLLARAVATGTDPLLPLPALAERFASHLPPPAFKHPTPHPPTLGLLLLLSMLVSARWTASRTASPGAAAAPTDAHTSLERPPCTSLRNRERAQARGRPPSTGSRTCAPHPHAVHGRVLSSDIGPGRSPAALPRSALLRLP
jgi:hypothetical protein